MKAQYLRLLRTHPRAAAMAYLPIARRCQIRLRIADDHVDVLKDDRAIRICHEHQFYLPSIIHEFEFFHSAVEPIHVRGFNIVDYSTPRFHEVKGYVGAPVLFPALAEPIETSLQYLRHAQLSKGSVAIDLGAYSGLTSILLDRQVGKEGRVIAVEADRNNLACVKRNLDLHEKLGGRKIELIHAAIWRTDGDIQFSSEGNMGSSATSIVGAGRASSTTIPALTLTSLANQLNLKRVDFIKCDIEGAEAVIFDQPRFFQRFQPRMIVEVHPVDGVSTSEACKAKLGEFGYVCQEFPQVGSDLPLLECVPG